MVTPAERQLIHRIFAQGPSALAEAGYDGDTAQAFLRRDDVQREWAALQREFDSQEIVFGHTRFVLRRQLTRLGPGALAVLGTALAGPEYARNASGTILTDAKGHPILVEPEPTPTQMIAARDILDRLDVEGAAKEEPLRANINILFQKERAEKITLPIDPALGSEEERALSRERIRNVIAVLHERLPTLRDAAATLLAQEQETAAKPAKVRRTVKAPTARRSRKAKKSSRRRRAVTAK